MFDKYVYLLVVLTFNEVVISGTPRKTLLTVYYESKCPDSKKFILNQLHPTMQMLHDYVHVQFVPFGKSKSINYGDNGFECQHGPPECLGNIVQDCALFHMKHSSDLERLDYVACEMATEAGAQGDLQCVQNANLSVNQIAECVLKGKGTILQLESEYFTSLVDASFIPTVTLNGVFDKQIQDNAQEDLFGTICSVSPDMPPCARHYNNIALGHIMQEPARHTNWL